MGCIDSYEHTDGTNPDGSFFDGDIYQEYDCYEIKCDGYKECRSAVDFGYAFTVCPGCGRALRNTDIQYTCECGCVIEPREVHNKPFVVGFALKNILLHAIRSEEDTI